MFDELGLMMIMMYPIVPIFLILLHFSINLWRKIGLLTYAIILLEWLPIGYLLFTLREPLLSYQINLGVVGFVIGLILFILAGVLHVWTAKLIGLKATIGYTELKPNMRATAQNLVTSGPFSIVRHPSYWAHIAIDTGLYLITGIATLGLIAIIDFLIIYFVIVNLEDRELINRFGERYKQYKEAVPKFFPKTKEEIKVVKSRNILGEVGKMNKPFGYLLTTFYLRVTSLL